MTLLSINDVLSQADVDIGQLKRIARDAMPFIQSAHMRCVDTNALWEGRTR